MAASFASNLNPFHKSSESTEKTEDSEDGEQSLSTILSPTERSSLTLLLNTSISSMRRTITDTFDPRYAGLPSDSQFDRFSGAANPLENKNLDLSNVDVEKLDKERKDAERRIKELLAPEIQGLKKDALKSFESWKEKVLSRVGEVVNSKKEAKEQ